MITLEEFYRAFSTFRHLPDTEQRQAVEQPPQAPLFIVAGPGTGKTTCLTFRILKLILVDDILPDSILATTFTKKAAAELRSRILGWGFRLIETLLSDDQIQENRKEFIRRVDINQVITGTIDSICEQILRDFRDPGIQPPALVDEFVSKTLMLRDGLLATQLYQNQDLDSGLLRINGNSRFGWHIGKKNDIIMDIWERRWQDQVNWPHFIEQLNANKMGGFAEAIESVIAAYSNSLHERGVLDFALLEQEVLQRLRAGQLHEFTDHLQVILIDEYQDTNLVQESLYFEMAQACHGALCVVGDDDQSLYRFRGATVELFSNFSNRYEAIFHQSVQPIFIRNNYRSTQGIVHLVNDYANLDPAYQAVRVQSKPGLADISTNEGVPVLGMFRNSTEDLARDLSRFIADIFCHNGYTLPNGAVVQRNSEGGALGDCAFLCSSPAEYKSDNKPRLPLLLRNELQPYNVQVFNPRGQDLSQIPLVARFGGLILEALDPGGVLEAQTSGLSQDMLDTFHEWRDSAIGFAVSDDAPTGLLEYARGWADRDPGRNGWVWPPSVPVLDLVYGLVHYFLELHDDSEGQIYLEVFTRQISACEQVGKFKGRVVHRPDEPGLSEVSVKELLRNFLGPIASGTIKVNEELMDSFPRDRLSILSIHQSKGLEFPLVIVDVGSEFKSNHRAHAFKRFPQNGGLPHELEDLLRPSTVLGAPNRSQQDRAFDDLYRQYFVAYSRPQDLLLLVGLNATLPGGMVPNVATGYRRNQTNPWANNPAFINI